MTHINRCRKVTFPRNMWMLLIVKLLSFKRYNYPFYKCRENGRQMQCAYSQPVSDKVVPLLFSFFVKFWKQMQCIVSQPLPFLVLQNAYLVAKIQIYIGLEQTIILKKIIPQLFFRYFNRTTSCITVNELQTMGNVNMVYIIRKQTRYASAYRIT